MNNLVSASRRARGAIATLALVLIVLLAACRPAGESVGTPETLSGTDTPMAVQPAPAATSTAVPTAPASTPTPLPPLPTSTSPPPSATSLADVTVFPDPAGFTWQPVVRGLERPLALTHAGDGSGRLFVVEQAGVIRILRDGVLLPAPFLDIRDRVGSQANEQGLLGLAFHPRYTENGHFFVNYTDRRGDTVIARFSTSADPDLADPASEVPLLQVGQPYGNHNGGGLTFGPDGYLYIGLGDGGAAGDPQGNGQALDTLLGKLLRIDVDGGAPYAIPEDNPFSGGQGRPEIWAYGLRNPWRFAFDPLTGDLYLGDVGQNAWEEIDFQAAGIPGGINFGWDYREGAHPFEGSPPAGLVLVEPVAEYDHSQGCSVTGGEVYRGAQLPALWGVYLYGDYCSGRVWGLLRGAEGRWQVAQLFVTDARIASFGVDENGELYLVDHGGAIYLLARR